jgi:hypothetical protein
MDAAKTLRRMRSLYAAMLLNANHSYLQLAPALLWLALSASGRLRTRANQQNAL